MHLRATPQSLELAMAEQRPSPFSGESDAEEQLQKEKGSPVSFTVTTLPTHCARTHSAAVIGADVRA